MASVRTTHHFLDAIEDDPKALVSININQTTPLVSFEEAVQNLKHVMKNINKIIEKAKQHPFSQTMGLSMDELAAIHLYTTDHSKSHRNVSFRLNQALRSGEFDNIKLWLPYLKLLVNGLHKLPSFKGTIFCMTKDNISNAYQNDFVWRDFSSCMQTEPVLENFHDESSVYTLFRIKCVNGKNISDYSQSTAHDEVLLMPGTFLRVIKKCNETEGIHEVFLQELDHENSFLTSLISVPPSKTTKSLAEEGFNSNTIFKRE